MTTQSPLRTVSNPTTDKPNFEHQCGKCVFLGAVVAGGRMADLYFCPQGGLPTVIARYSDAGPDYASGIGGRTHTAELMVAYIRAKEKGLIAEA